MARLEDKIKDFVRGQGWEVFGIAGPDRLSGPRELYKKIAVENRGEGG